MVRIYGLPAAVWRVCALLLLGASVGVAARSGDAVLLAGAACAVLGLLVIAAPDPRRTRAAAAIWRRGVHVRKAVALEQRARQFMTPGSAPPRGSTHHAA